MSRIEPDLHCAIGISGVWRPVFIQEYRETDFRRAVHDGADVVVYEQDRPIVISPEVPYMMAWGHVLQRLQPRPELLAFQGCTP